MFHTAPRGHRTAPRTKIHIDKEHALPSKTPSRVGATGKPQVLGGAGPSTVGFNRLAPGTVLRDTRNLIQTGNGKAGKGKGKEAGDAGGKGDGIEPTRLFKTHIQSSKSSSGLSSTLAAPRQTPAPSKTRPTQTPLPSARRTSRRSRQSFATPIRQDGWEDDLQAADVSVEVAPADLQLGGLEEESDGEVEYMPPKAVELPFEPAFEHLDLGTIGQALYHKTKPGPIPVPEIDMVFEEQPAVHLAMSDVEEPLFAASDAAKARPAAPVKPGVRRPFGAGTSAGGVKTGLVRKPLMTTSGTVRKSTTTSVPVVRKPAIPTFVTGTRKPPVPTTNIRKPLLAPGFTTTRKVTATPSTGTGAPPRRPLALKANASANVAKPKPDPLAEIGVDFDDVCKELGGDDFEFCL